jgi:hypothetical protein
MSRAKDVTHKHSLKVAARAVMAAQRFSETPHETDDGATMTSNMHRSETTVPFNALIHFLTFSTELELSKPWQMKKPMVSTGTGFYIGNRRILTNSHVIRNATSLRVERHGQVRTAARAQTDRSNCLLKSRGGGACPRVRTWNSRHATRSARLLSCVTFGIRSRARTLKCCSGRDRNPLIRALLLPGLACARAAAGQLSRARALRGRDVRPRDRHRRQRRLLHRTARRQAAGGGMERAQAPSALGPAGRVRGPSLQPRHTRPHAAVYLVSELRARTHTAHAHLLRAPPPSPPPARCPSSTTL